MNYILDSLTFAFLIMSVACAPSTELSDIAKGFNDIVNDLIEHINEEMDEVVQDFNKVGGDIMLSIDKVRDGMVDAVERRNQRTIKLFGMDFTWLGEFMLDHPLLFILTIMLITVLILYSFACCINAHKNCTRHRNVVRLEASRIIEAPTAPRIITLG